MATEIERKYLVKGDSWRSLAVASTYCQGYIPTQGNSTVRVRIVGDKGYLTVKSPKVGFSRLEFEYLIPLNDAQEMLITLCARPLVEKMRYKVEWAGLIWEVDEFDGVNKGLILAEVELSHENQLIDLPNWVGEEVSHDARYFNSNLVKHPFTQW